MAWLVLLITNTLAVKVWHMGEPANRYGEKFPTTTNKYFISICRVIKILQKHTISYIQGVPKIGY